MRLHDSSTDIGLSQLYFPVRVDVCSAGEAATAKGGIMSLQDSGFVQKMWHPLNFGEKRKQKHSVSRLALQQYNLSAPNPLMSN